MEPDLLETLRRFFLTSLVEDFPRTRCAQNHRAGLAWHTDGVAIPGLRFDSTAAAFHALVGPITPLGVEDLTSPLWNTRATADQWVDALQDLLVRLTWLRERHYGAPPREHHHHHPDAHYQLACVELRTLVRLVRDAMRPGGEALRTPAFWEAYAVAMSEEGSFWDVWWLCASGQMAIFASATANARVPEAMAVSAVEALREAAVALFPWQRATCLSFLDTPFLEENEDNFFTGMRSFRLAIDALGLRRHVEERLTGMHLERVHGLRPRFLTQGEPPDGPPQLRAPF